MRTTGPGAVFAFNPVYAVELEPEGQRWSPAEAARFLAATAADPLGLMFRLVVLRGFRRGEAAGQRWAGAHLDDGYLTVDRTILQIGGMVAGGNPSRRPASAGSGSAPARSRCWRRTAGPCSPTSSGRRAHGRTTT